MEKLTYTLPELQNLKAEAIHTLKDLMTATSVVKSAAAALEKFLRESDSNQMNWRYEIEYSLVRDIKGVSVVLPHEERQMQNIKWKELVFKSIKKYNMPMNSQLIYQKFRQEMPHYGKDRRFIIKNISAALNALYNESKLFRHAFKGKNDYLYSIIEFYDASGNLKEEYFSKFKLEYEGV